MAIKPRAAKWTVTFLTFLTWVLVCVICTIMYLMEIYTERGTPEFAIGLLSACAALIYFFRWQGLSGSPQNIQLAWTSFGINIVGLLVSFFVTGWLSLEHQVEYFLAGSGIGIVAFSIARVASWR